MSRFKGTKGKWEIEYGKPKTFDYKVKIKNICGLFSQPEDDAEETEMFSNAKLISCAPELLDILKTILEEPRIREAMIISGENSILNDNIKKAKELIKKATEL